MLLPASILAVVGAMMMFFVVIVVILYVYSALAFMNIAKRTKTPNAWLAWIPVGNLVLMANIAKMHWWPVLLLIAFFIPFVNILAILTVYVFLIIWMWKICEARNKPGWWAVLVLIPFFGPIWQLVMMGILAWGK